ncbi:anthranilate synthase component I family protein [Myxococcus sp. CA051A]|uniref:Anthranilate synthase component I family protein n=1 Tax=Myxococcus llanfairpwllgwyngyllgogerychwyrndrobwllllantysiliogogogochensis TaxID=2590453 RepID=A0A540WMV4_9BACT|nr:MULTISPECIES: anthranilate synthase component I family protein [Myxococcus]NTX15759.1 anthranilate synthase component I family protein [Myxococcus sp. CA056]NTX38385.1 anthranilate synthase component I family protein [Myxococcus sp. CA033]NTX55370.1 anthranilate synthase component I family protein [Myxococcus sp. CA039A]NTX65372.1 anthranilate synthase component I family protein [Myxococcus sp. CA051A]TQF10359.1 anthranilate synthase component I family protein [Myxococcus llanfairpwllgwyngy
MDAQERKAAYRQRAEQGEAVPVSVELPADLDTPLSAYLKLGGGSRGFILESCYGGERFGRYSHVGTHAAGRVRLDAHGATVWRGSREERRDGKPMDVLRSLWRELAVARLPGEAPFLGGLVGYMDYNCVSWMEPTVPDRHPRDTSFPDSEWLISEDFVTHDSRTGTLKVTAIARPSLHASVAVALKDAEDRAQSMAERLLKPLPPEAYAPSPRMKGDGEPVACWDRASYEAAVERSKEYIRAGDIFQVVLARRFESRGAPPPLSLYRALRRVNPSPYLFLVELGEARALVGASPELLVQVRDGDVVVRPIAGTRRRGASEAEDLALEKELLADEKERAEHIMLVDLGRNDVGRVAAPGSVRVEDLMVIERYSHVMHIVSQVRGKLDSKFDALDALASTFPAGTVSGAPKIRAMQIIDELEVQRRGPYSGAVGYLSFCGTLDVAIALRTFFVDGDRTMWTAGAGLVADSVPSKEADETEAKAGAMAAALRLAREGGGR